jgi:hypothetical protein
MENTQYLALVELQKEFQNKALEIAPESRVFTDISVHSVDVDAEVWEHQEAIINIRKSDKLKYLTNSVLSKIDLYSKDF